MAYCSQSDVERAAGGAKRLVQLADWDGNTAADSSVVTDTIGAVEAWVESYVAKQRAVPLVAPVPMVILALTADEVVFRLKRRRGMATEDDKEAHGERMEWLDGVAKARISLGVDPQPSASSTVVADAGTRSTDGGAFGRDELGGLW